MSIFDDMDKIKTQFEDVIEKLLNHAEEDMAINIIVDDSDPQYPVFVEIENDKGESIGIGVDTTTENGYRKIRISTADIVQHDAI